MGSYFAFSQIPKQTSTLPDIAIYTPKISFVRKCHIITSHNIVLVGGTLLDNIRVKSKIGLSMCPKTMIPQIITLFILILSPKINSVCYNYPAVFNFGDSNSDTGELASGLGFQLGTPNGQLYFKTPNGRFCDGRLILDFLGKFLNLYFS